MSESIVKSIVFNRSYDGQHGKSHVFNLVFENGDYGEYTAKTNPQTFFEVGKAGKYSIEAKTGTKKDGTPFSYNKIVPIRESNFGGEKELSPEEQDRIKRQVFLRAASHMHAMWRLDKKELFELFESQYLALCKDKPSRISFLNVLNTISEEALFHVPLHDIMPELKDLSGKIISYFNYVMGVKK